MRFNFQFLDSEDLPDRAGAVLSWLCAVHCLAMPFLISFLPVVGISFLAHEGIEYVFVGLSIAVALVTLLPGYFKEHRKIRTLLLFVSGIGFVIFADTLFEENIFGKILFVGTGAICITLAHLVNRRLCRSCRKCRRNECQT